MNVRSGNRTRPTDEPTPKAIRASIPAAFREPSLAYAVVATGIALAVHGAGIALFVLGSGWLRVAAVVPSAAGLATLFVFGHEAQHLHFSGRKRLDAFLSYVALLPTWHAVRVVTYAHVKLHHRYTNVRGLDPQWEPFGKREYDALPRYRRALERLYRSWWGFGLYWTLQVVIRLGLDPRGPLSNRLKPRDYALDRAIAVGFAAANVALWIALAPYLELPWLATLGFYIGSVLLAHWVIGFATYFQHTGPGVHWYATPAEWSFYGAQITGTQDFFLGIYHHAHHVDMTIPACHLGDAQRALTDAFPRAKFVAVREMPSIVRRCKLYDCERRAWTDFAGNVTA